MRAIVLQAQDGAFHDCELPEPPLRPGDVRIRVAAASFNPIDYQLRRKMVQGGAVASNILGRDLSGVVEAVGDGVTEFAPGDAVYSYIGTIASSGAYAECVSVPVELVAAKPESLTFEQAAAVPVVGVTAFMALEKLGTAPGKSMFVAGASGGVGSFALELARRSGLDKVIASAGRSESRAYLVERFGLREAQLVDYRDPEFVAEALARNAGPFDRALDLVGGTMLTACCRLVAIDGHVASATEAPTLEDAEHLFEANASFHAIGANAYMLSPDRVAWRRYRGMLQELTRMFDEREIRPPLTETVGPFSAETVARAHERLERSAVVGKLVMVTDYLSSAASSRSDTSEPYAARR